MILQRILQSDWLTAFLAITEGPRFFQTFDFWGTMKNIVCTIFGVKKRDQWIKLLESQKPYVGGGMFRLFPKNENISEFLDT